MKNLNSIFLWCIIVKFGYAAILDSNKHNKSTTNLNLQITEDIQKEKTQCEYYNSTCFSDKKSNKSSLESCQGIETCPDETHICFVVWKDDLQNNNLEKKSHHHNSENNKNDTQKQEHKSGKNVFLMGCFENSNECSEEDECVENYPGQKSHKFCCCRGQLCNSKFDSVPHVVQNTEIMAPNQDLILPEVNEESSNNNEIFWILFFLAIFSLIVLVMAAFFLISKKFQRRKFEASAENESGLRMGLLLGRGSTGGEFAIEDIQLPENIILTETILGRGKFGKVVQGFINEEENISIAVKVFMMPSSEAELSWSHEKYIYSLSEMSNHENILKFLGVSVVQKNSEFWLGTEYHAKGSLYSYLNSNLISWNELWKISLSIAKGLAFLHDESDTKPAIAHRDFKSKNVLVKDDFTACISDFGLAMVLNSETLNANAQVAQNGTYRYMAPEVLEGVITFEKDSFTRVDMYACGLVLWELTSRLKENFEMENNSEESTTAVEEYKLPYEAEIPNNPTLDQMKKLVADDKVRPQLKTGTFCWKSQPRTNFLCEIITDLWDHEEKARISAACVEERIFKIQDDE